MATRQFDSVLQQIRRLAEGREGNPWTDRQLLDRFINKNEEAAFAALVRRHGPMVLSLGWRILRDREDAEDVFQAAFLVLARKARSIHKQDSIGGWLYRVAFRLALRVRAQAAKRCRPMLSKPEASPADPLAEISWREICAALDEELARLPDRLRAPLVLCYLEGKTQDEAQHQLGWSKSTFGRRLEEGRNRLCSRLTRRGITLSAGLWATLLSDPGASAAVSTTLWQATVRAAMAFAAGEIAGAAVSPQVSLLIKEGLKSAFVCKMKWVALAGMVTVLTTGMGLAAHQALKANQATGAAREPLALADERRDQPKLEKANQARVDRYGDPLPPGARVRMGSIRLRPAEGGKSSGYYLEFLPGGKVLATEGYKGIRFWDVGTGKETRRIEAPGGGTWSFALSPDGKTLAASCFDDTIRLWDAATGKELRKIKSSAGAILAFSHDGRKLVSAAEIDFRFRLWNLATGKEELTIDPQRHRSHALSFAADDRTLVSWDYNQGIFYWDVASGKQLRQFAPGDEQLRRFFSPAGGMTSVAFSPDGKLLAAGCLDHTIRIADQATGKEIRKMESREGQAVAFSPDAKILFAHQEGGSILWDVASGKPVRKISATGRAVFSPDGKTLAVGGGDKAISLWDVATGKELLHPGGHENSISRLAFSPDGKLLATRSFSDQTIRLWEADTGRELHLLRLPDCGGPMAFTADGKSLVAGSWDGTVRFWDPSTGKETRKILIDPDKPGRQKWETIVDAIQLLPDGKSLATCSSKSAGIGPGKGMERTGLIQSWDLATGKQLLKHETTVPAYHPGTYFSPDGKVLVYEKSNQIVVWDVARNKKRLTLSLSEHNNTGGMAFSPDGKYLAAVTLENPSWVRLWELTTAQQVLAIPTKDSLVEFVAFSLDGKVIAWGCDEAVRLWDVATGKELLRRSGHGVRVHCLEFAPDGRTLACGLADSTALIWDLAPDTWRAGMPSRELTREDLDRTWADLAGQDAAKGHQAIWTLVAVPGQAVALFKERLQPTSEHEQKRIQQWIAELDHAQFTVRERASRELEQCGAEAEVALLRVLRQNPSTEVHKRIEALLDLPQIIRSGECLRRLRAIQALEHIQTPEAEKVLKSLAQGAPEARLTQEAKASVERLAKRPSVRP